MPTDACLYFYNCTDCGDLRSIREVLTLDAAGAEAEKRIVPTRIELVPADPGFRAFHENRSDMLPEFYHHLFEQRLGRYAELIPRGERTPILEPPAALVVSRQKERVLLPTGVN